MTELDIQTLLFPGLGAVWWVFPLAIFLLVIRSSWFKGRLGEFLVARSFRKHLDPLAYTALHDVTLSVGDGTTQIDHVVVSRYGVFVIETKNMSGWIFGDEQDRHWTQTLHRKRFQFQNPLRQNVRHMKAVAEITGLPEHKLHSLVIFTGSAKFKNQMPENVTRHTSGVWFMRTKTEQLLSDNEVQGAIRCLTKSRLTPGAATNRAHIQNTKTRLSAPLCPKCGGAMEKRTTRKGTKAGSRFWGCSGYPQCRGTRPVAV